MFTQEINKERDTKATKLLTQNKIPIKRKKKNFFFSYIQRLEIEALRQQLNKTQQGKESKTK